MAQTKPKLNIYEKILEFFHKVPHLITSLLQREATKKSNKVKI